MLSVTIFLWVNVVMPNVVAPNILQKISRELVEFLKLFKFYFSCSRTFTIFKHLLKDLQTIVRLGTTAFKKGKTTLSITTVRIVTLCIMTLSIMKLSGHSS
jgi:hypothetical protein